MHLAPASALADRKYGPSSGKPQHTASVVKLGRGKRLLRLSSLSGQERARMRQRRRWQTARRTRKLSDRPPGGESSVQSTPPRKEPDRPLPKPAATRGPRREKPRTSTATSRLECCTHLASKSRIAPPQKPCGFRPRADPIQQGTTKAQSTGCWPCGKGTVVRKKPITAA